MPAKDRQDRGRRVGWGLSYYLVNIRNFKSFRLPTAFQRSPLVLAKLPWVMSFCSVVSMSNASTLILQKTYLIKFWYLIGTWSGVSLYLTRNRKPGGYGGQLINPPAVIRLRFRVRPCVDNNIIMLTRSITAYCRLLISTHQRFRSEHGYSAARVIP